MRTGIAYRQRKGVALVAILAIAAVLLGIISVGLKMGSDGVLFVSAAHRRNVALSAAEAGVYEAMVALQADKGFSGPGSGDLTEAHATYSFTVDNDLFGQRVATVISTGEYGGTRRTLRVQLEPDSAGFDGLSVNGKVYVFDQAYVNGIASTASPVNRPGHAHTNFGGGSAYIAQDFDSDGAATRLHATGDLSAQGGFDTALSRVSRSEETGVTQPQYRLDPVEMASGSFTTVTSLSPGTLSGNTEITGDIELTGKLIVPEGVTLVVHGNANFLGGISGDGQVVVDGDVLLRTDANYDPTVEEGIKLCAGESVFVTHPKTSIEDGEISGGEFNEVGDFFAQMPMQATTELSTNIPVEAPRGADFFGWFDSEVGSPNSEFSIWYNGDGTDIYPGLSEETKAWLEQSRTMHTQIAAWAAASAAP
jgi:hypothetical protein